MGGPEGLPMLDRVGAPPPPKGSAHFQEAQTAKSPVQTHQGRLETKSHGLWTGATHLSKPARGPCRRGGQSPSWGRRPRVEACCSDERSCCW